MVHVSCPHSQPCLCTNFNSSYNPSSASSSVCLSSQGPRSAVSNHLWSYLIVLTMVSDHVAQDTAIRRFETCWPPTLRGLVDVSRHVNVIHDRAFAQRVQVPLTAELNCKFQHGEISELRGICAYFCSMVRTSILQGELQTRKISSVICSFGTPWTLLLTCVLEAGNAAVNGRCLAHRL